MQGRLVAMEGDRIQAFPKGTWEQEFALAARFGYQCIELTIEMESWEDHPLRTPAGRRRIAHLVRTHGVSVAGVCCDVFMQCPLGAQPTRNQARGILSSLIDDAHALGLDMMELPMLGPNRIDDESREPIQRTLEEAQSHAGALGMQLLLEVDLSPQALSEFLAECGQPNLGINYDMGNSAYFGFRADDELDAYGEHVRNVHVKDCTPEDYSVPLGQGDVDFDLVFKKLAEKRFRGDFIFQTYRDPGADPVEEMRRYLAFVAPYLERHFPAKSPSCR